MSEGTEAEPAAEPDDADEPLAPAAMAPADPPASARRALLLLTIGAGVLFASQTMMAVGVPLVGDGYGLTAAVIGVVIAVPAVIPLFLAVFLGRWVSRVGSRKALVLAGSAHVLGGLLCWLLPSLLGLLLGQLVFGLGLLLVGISSQAMVPDISPKGQLERAFAFYSSGMSIGQLIGPFIAGLLLGYASPAAFFLVVAVVSLLGTGVLAGLPRQLRGDPAMARSGGGLRQQIGLLWRSPPLLISIVAMGCLLFSAAASTTLLPLLLSANGVSATTIGILSSLRSLAAILVRPWTVPITRFLGGSARALTWTLFLTAAAAAALAFPPYLPWIGLMQLLMGVGAGLTIPLAMAIGVASLPTHERGPAVALRLMGNRVAQISGPLLLGAVAQALGFFSAFLLSGLVAGALATWVRRIRRGAEASGRMEGG